MNDGTMNEGSTPMVAQRPGWLTRILGEPGDPGPRLMGPVRLLLLIGTAAAVVTALTGVVLVATEPSESSVRRSLGVVNPPGPAGVLAFPNEVGPGGPGAVLTAAVEGAPPPQPAGQPAGPMGKAGPTRLVIPDIRVDAPLRPVGVTERREIEVPPLSARNLAGWFKYGPTPGELGPAVIVGHVNSRSGPAVFQRLREVTRGQTIKIGRADGSVAVFTVDGVEQVSKSAFPTARVYGNTAYPALRLITCGGVYNRKTHSYTDNLIVYATLTSVSST
ncbi:class F sortase [Acrocarpospora catenulata]|uniref:class F sortase n=1 Tax=Acrocarpospora catenulata TaxID=2836182 RepID=UPI001BD91DFD|nr:class F sortase [Acrocarpospora catenulata]